MVKEVGAEKAQLIVKQEIDKLVPSYLEHYNNLTAVVLVETLSSESLQALKNTGETTPHKGDKNILEVEKAKIAAQKVQVILNQLLTKAMGSAFSKVVPVNSQSTGVKKSMWLKSLKPTEVNYQCSNSPVGKQFKGTKAECYSKIGSLFDKCAYQVPNVHIPEVLATQKDAEKHGAILGECIAAYYFGGDHLKAFNSLQNRSPTAN